MMNLSSKISILFLGLSVVFAGNLLASENSSSQGELLQQYQLKVTGLKCRDCIPDVRRSLKRVAGVRDARVTHFDKTGSTTLVEVTPESVSGEQLLVALRDSGFKASILSVAEPRRVVLEDDSGFRFFGLFD